MYVYSVQFKNASIDTTTFFYILGKVEKHYIKSTRLDKNILCYIQSKTNLFKINTNVLPKKNIIFLKYSIKIM